MVSLMSELLDEMGLSPEALLRHVASALQGANEGELFAE